MDLPADIEEALALAGGNRRELKAVLRHYRQDSLKFRAACFLIANMRWHYSDDSGYCLYSDAKDSDLCDLRRFDRSFLISHVDHAFDVWESSPCAAGLSFCEFCEYILPYRSLAGYPDCFSGAELYDLFGKYVGAGQGDSLAGYVARYNRVKTDFEGAEKLFTRLSEEIPNESEGFWGVLMCRCGLEYEVHKIEDLHEIYVQFMVWI